MKTLLKALCVLAATAFISSCIQDDTILYSDLRMVNVEGPSKLITDEGLVYNIVENSVSAIPDTLKRIMILCDVLNESGTTEDEYDIRLLNFARVLTKDAVLKSAADEEALGSDAIVPAQLWTGGKYINAAIQFTTVTGSKTYHTVNLVFDDTRNNPDTLFFSLRHNAHGESFENEEIDPSLLTTSSDYVSFPIADYIPAGKEKMVVKLECDWYKSEFQQYIREKEHHSIDFTFSK